MKKNQEVNRKWSAWIFVFHSSYYFVLYCGLRICWEGIAP